KVSHVTLGQSTSIVSHHGSVLVHAGGSTRTESTAETAVFQDGTLGVAISVSVDNADITARADGTIVAEHPTNAFTFTAGSATVVDINGDTITISVPEIMAL